MKSNLSPILIPQYPQFRKLPSFNDTMLGHEIAIVAAKVLADFGDVVGQCDQSVRQNLESGTLHSRKWALRTLRRVMAEVNQPLLDGYYSRLEAARQQALLRVGFLWERPEVLSVLESTPAHSEMGHEARIALRDAILVVKQSERGDVAEGPRSTIVLPSGPSLRGHGPSPAQRAKKAARSGRDRERTLATRGDAVKKR